MTTPYIDPNLIFAENAPTQDKPAAFENYDKGWDESRKNDGRPLIKQMNYLQQQADLKNLYIHENGAALPYKEGVAYEENAVVVKDGVLQQWSGGVWVNVSAQEVKKYLIAAGVDESELDGDYDFLMQRLAQIAVDKGWDASFVLYHGISQKKINDGLDSIAELLSIPNPFNSMRVFVKSYTEGNGVGYLGEATPYKGGNWFIYKSSRAAENDGVFIFNGWERFLESDTYTPYMAGCKCDGVTDDAQKLDKLNYALFTNKLKGRVVFDKSILINSELPRTGNLQFVETTVKIGFRLVGGIHYEIQDGVSIKVGNYFNDSGTYVFCAANPASAADYSDENPQNDVHLYGGGTIDSTGAGSMATSHGRTRYLVFLGGCTNFHMHGLTTIGGDYQNIIVSRRKATGARIYNNWFKDTIVTGSLNQDHSTIWSAARDWKVYNNRFTDASPKAQIMNCAFESHGSEHYFYNNFVDNYLVAVLQCAYKWDPTQPAKDNMYVYGNTSNSWFFLTFWFQAGGVQPYGFMDCFDNTHNSLPFVSKAQLMADGVPETIIDVRDLTRRAFVSSAAAIAKDYEVKVNKAQQFRNNSFYASFSPELFEQFFDMRVFFNEGVHIFKNYMKTPRLFVIKNQFALNIPIVLRNYIWKDNDVDFGGAVFDKMISELNVHRLNNCHFEVHINASYHQSLATRTPSTFSVVDPDNSKNNTLVYTHNGQANLEVACSGVTTTLNAPFYANNKIVLDTKSNFIVSPDTTNPKIAKFFTTESNRNFKSCEILSYDEATFGSFVPPAKLYKSANHTSASFIGVALDFSMLNTDTTTKSGKAHSRYTT